MNDHYVHGYHDIENQRLQNQAQTLESLLHSDTGYASGCSVLEVGCGVGAQTVALARRSPSARFVSIDVSADSLREASDRVMQAGLTNVEFQEADIFNLPFSVGAFDHVFVCFVLEHLSRPLDALSILHSMVKPGGTITVIEGDHGSTYFHPDSAAARAVIECQIRMQEHSGGNACIGRQLYPLLRGAGFKGVRVTPRTMYVDSSRPDLVDRFIRRTFTAMIEGVRDRAVLKGYIEAEQFDLGVADLYRTTQPDGVFCYTFFKAVGER